ncbi:uncharacterized protein IAS62_005265 [Cryptococcus decagattii]|uniref:Uncharacterized protein n=1 Tax=Cryptococcus decagattii TaxID=1859122 RepID=A0ABZ2AZT1_9TREE
MVMTHWRLNHACQRSLAPRLDVRCDHSSILLLVVGKGFEIIIMRDVGAGIRSLHIRDDLVRCINGYAVTVFGCEHSFIFDALLLHILNLEPSKKSS